MAKAKNESTAINDLINLVNTATPLPPDPDEDLMFADPGKRKSQAVSVPRMSATVPTLKVGAEVAPLPRGRGATGTGENLVTPPQIRVTTAPPSRQTTIPPIATATPPERPTKPTLPPPAPRGNPMNQRFDLSQTSSVGHNIPASSIGITVPAAPIYPRAPSNKPVDMTADQPWFDGSSIDVDTDEAVPSQSTGSRHEQTWVGTVQTPKTATTLTWVGRLAPIAGAMIVIGIFVGGYVAFDGEGGHARTAAAATVQMPVPKAEPAAAAAAPVAAPVTEPAKTEEPVAASIKSPAEEPAPTKTEPAPAPVQAVAAAAAPIETPKGRPVFTDVRIDSNPPGATVTLIDRGKRMFLGTTPISTSVDVARQYDVELVYNNRPTVVEHLDPMSTKKLSIEIHRVKSATTTEIAQPAAVVASAPVKAPAPKKAAVAKVSFADVTEKPKAETPKVEAAKTEAPKAEPAAAEPSGTGILMISSKPPCEILIDGQATGLRTPQRALPISVGTHKVTLVNEAEKVKKTLTIKISPDQPTKVIQDLMGK